MATAAVCPILLARCRRKTAIGRYGHGWGLWRDFCIAGGGSDLIADPRFDSAALKLVNRDIMRTILRPIFAQKATEAWLAILREVGVPSGPIHTIEQICSSEQIAAPEMLVDVGGVKVSGCPMKFAGNRRASVTRPCPR
jgi:crotonobetainyl-CoA:carnitine CoA-transferase CaiB-like acyl-CoA transferase